MLNRPALQIQYSDCQPNELVRSVGHHRMPMLLTSKEEYSAWLNPEAVERETLEPLMSTVQVEGWCPNSVERLAGGYTAGHGAT